MLIGFHGQTIYHNSEEKISKQLGNGKLLNQLTKKKIIFNFRKNDILNDGEGAPLAPIFHQLIVAKHSIETPVCLLNIGGISNLTVIIDKFDNQKLFSRDLGPGNCLIDNWIRNSSKFKYDSNGKFAETGELNDIILEQAQELYANRINKEKLSFDVNDFDISFARGLSLKDGAATLTQFTAEIISERISFYLSKLNCNPRNILLCGGGRKNKFLIKKIKNLIPINLKLNSVDDLNVNGDFIESQAFGYIAIRSYKNLPITFPNTTGCKMPCSGGEIIEN